METGVEREKDAQTLERKILEGHMAETVQVGRYVHALQLAA